MFEMTLISKIGFFAQKGFIINIFKNNKNFIIKQIMICIFCWIITIRWLLVAINTNPKVWSLFGDPFYYTNDRVLCNLVMFGLSLLSSLFTDSIT